MLFEYQIGSAIVPKCFRMYFENRKTYNNTILLKIRAPFSFEITFREKAQDLKHNTDVSAIDKILNERSICSDVTFKWKNYSYRY